VWLVRPAATTTATQIITGAALVTPSATAQWMTATAACQRTLGFLDIASVLE